MNVHLRWNRDGSQVWRLEVYDHGRRAVRTIDAVQHKRDLGRKEAEEAWRSLRDEVRQHRLQHIHPSRQGTASYLTGWLAREVARLKPTTLAGYRVIIERHLIPQIGHIPVNDLAPLTLQGLWDSIADQGHVRTAILARTILHKALQDGVRLGVVTANVVDRTLAPSATVRRQIQPFTWTEIEALIATAPDRWRPLLTFAALTGLRRGEICALRWADWDRENRTVVVRRSAVVVNGKPVIQDGSDRPATKTRAGLRRLSLPERAHQALVEQRRWADAMQATANDEWDDTGWIFSTRMGGLLHPRNIARAYENARSAAGLRPESFHALRHFAASMMIGMGIPVEIVSKRLGHGSRAVTVDTYGHLLPEVDQAAADHIDRWLEHNAARSGSSS